MQVRLIAALSVLLVAAGCISTDTNTRSGMVRHFSVVDAADSERLNRGDVGGILVDFNISNPCHNMAVRYVNIESGETYRHFFGRGYASNGPATISIMVPPGLYEFRGGVCNFATFATTHVLRLDEMALWMRPIEVRAGEIVYAGTLLPHRVMFQGGVEMGRADSYALFSVQNRFTGARAAFSSFNPTLADRVVDRTASALLDKDAVQKIIAEAYAQTIGDAPPNADAARARFRAARARAATDFQAYRRAQVSALGIPGAGTGAETLAPEVWEHRRPVTAAP